MSNGELNVDYGTDAGVAPTAAMGAAHGRNISGDMGVRDLAIGELGGAIERGAAAAFSPAVEARPAQSGAAAASPVGTALPADAAQPPIARSALKRAFDIVGAISGLIVTAPLLVVIYLIVRRDGGPGVFVQRRIGRNGTPFACLKFRTMAAGAEDMLETIISRDPELKREWEMNRKLTNDPRVTKVGAFLRRKSLDELPQLVNILRGEMSLVGPRPIVPEERACYGEDFVYYKAVRPGLTGLWQVSGRNEITYTDRVKLDRSYVDRWSFVGDLRIILATVGAVASGRGAR